MIRWCASESRCVFLSCAALAACSTTLDPTVSPPAGEAGADGAGILAPCTPFRADGQDSIVCPDPLAHAAAAHDCKLRGARLAEIHSAQQNERLATEAARTVGTNLWLGATRDDALLWSWGGGDAFWLGATDGSSVAGAYANWQPGEPNDASTVVAEPEKCAALTLGGNDWNDRACSLLLPYVCQWPAD